MIKRTFCSPNQNSGSQADSHVSNETEVSVRDLAREIVAIEQDTTRENATGDEYHSVYTALTQSHLPQLDDIEVIEYQQNRKFVRASQNLIPVALIASISSPVVQFLFQDEDAALYDRSSSPEDSITDL
jgi:hypothetical protein